VGLAKNVCEIVEELLELCFLFGQPRRFVRNIYRKWEMRVVGPKDTGPRSLCARNEEWPPARPVTTYYTGSAPAQST
jgi:hypothetical protein